MIGMIMELWCAGLNVVDLNQEMVHNNLNGLRNLFVFWKRACKAPLESLIALYPL